MTPLNKRLCPFPSSVPHFFHLKGIFHPVDNLFREFVAGGVNSTVSSFDFRYT